MFFHHVMGLTFFQDFAQLGWHIKWFKTLVPHHYGDFRLETSGSAFGILLFPALVKGNDIHDALYHVCAVLLALIQELMA